MDGDRVSKKWCCFPDRYARLDDAFSLPAARRKLGTNGQRQRVAVIARSASDEAIHFSIECQRRDGLLRGACHPAALRADRVARNDAKSFEFSNKL
jgi:hypothetical protein